MIQLFASHIAIKGMKKYYHENINQKKTELAILIAGKVDFRAKKITGDRHIR